VIRAAHLPPGPSWPAPAPRALGTGATEYRALAQISAGFAGTRSELAATLGISERTLYRRLKALGLA